MTINDTSCSSRRELLLKIQETDFFAYDLQLYLNTHPDCERAMSLYSDAVRKSKELKNEYEAKYGPLTAFQSVGKLPWQWSKNPWTWEKDRS